MSPFTFSGSRAVITGGGSGVGRSIALELAHLGAHVLIADIDESAGAHVAKEIQRRGGAASFRWTDVRDAQSVVALADHAYSTLGRVDLLCNNAGISWRPSRAVWDADVEDFRLLMDVNYFGVVHGLLAFLPRMRKTTGRKHVVNTTSAATILTVPGLSGYSASKSAVDSLTNALREELQDHGDDIGVTVLCAGLLATGISANSELHGARSGRTDPTPYAYQRRFESAQDRSQAPDLVGKQLVAAIREDAPYCLTHAASDEDLEERVRLWRGAHRVV